MKKKIIGAFCALALMFGAAPLHAQGSLPIALQQVSDQNGKPIVGALLYFYQVGTVATRQDSFQDTALVNPNQWPLPSDAYGRIPMFYVASGSIHVRLTDPGGLVIFDYPNMLVIGPSGGGGGAGAIDPTTIASTGDMKFRPSAEVLTGWVRMNGNTIGNAVSGATERANADTQALFIYLWGLGMTPSGGRGASGLADFNASKAMPTIDMRGMAPHGLDTMGAAAAGRLAGALFASGNASTPLSTGGEASHVLTVAELPPITPTWNQTGGSASWTQTGGSGTANWGQTGTGTATFSGTPAVITATLTDFMRQSGFTITPSAGAGLLGSAGTVQAPSANYTPAGSVTGVTGITGNVGITGISVTGNVTGVSVTGNVTGFGSGTAGNRMAPFILGTFFIKL